MQTGTLQAAGASAVGGSTGRCHLWRQVIYGANEQAIGVARLLVEKAKDVSGAFLGVTHPWWVPSF